MKYDSFFKSIFNKQVVGLDIGSHSVKAVKIMRENGQISLNKTGYSKVNPANKESGISLKQAASDIWRGQNFETNKVGISLSGKKVIARYIEMPYMEEKDLKKALPFEIQPSIPYSLDEVALTFQVVDEFEKNGKKTIRVLYAVSLKEEIDKIIGLLTDLKLEVVFIDLDMISLGRAYRLNRSVNEEDVLMVNIGDNTTNFNFLHDGATLFARDIEWGGDALAVSLRRNLKITYEEAEEIKKKRDLIDIDNGKARPNPHIAEALNRLSEEINLVIRHCMFNYHAGMPEIIYISGGGALLVNLGAYLEQSLEIPVKIFNPFENITQINFAGAGENSQINPTVFTAALGLALRAE